MTYGGIISRVEKDSIASEIGLVPGDRLLKVNGEVVKDIIDLSFALADENIELLIEKVSGEQEIIEIEKDYDQDIGLEFESAVFDNIKRCANKCIFCFVDQMPPGMRKSLYVKDDDYRLSFLYGNFITLTNLTSADVMRIKKLHLSPLYVSVHATDGTVRARMLNNKRAGDIMESLTMLIANGVSFHAQVVLCPEINDGDVLEKTIADLYNLYPHVLSVAIVPVGLSKFRENCYPLHPFSKAQAREVISLVSRWQKKAREERQFSFVYLADEFYLKAELPLPDYEWYDDFPQIENGVGIVRNFIEEWHAVDVAKGAGYDVPNSIDVVCGVSAAPILKMLVAELNIPNLKIRIVPVENNFFGRNITVTGLLTGKDIVSALTGREGVGTGLIIPGVALKKGEDIFLDDMTLSDLEKKFKVPVRVAFSAKDLKDLLSSWR